MTKKGLSKQRRRQKPQLGHIKIHPFSPSKKFSCTCFEKSRLIFFFFFLESRLDGQKKFSFATWNRRRRRKKGSFWRVFEGFKKEAYVSKPMQKAFQLELSPETSLFLYALPCAWLVTIVIALRSERAKRAFWGQRRTQRDPTRQQGCSIVPTGLFFSNYYLITHREVVKRKQGSSHRRRKKTSEQPWSERRA